MGIDERWNLVSQIGQLEIMGADQSVAVAGGESFDVRAAADQPFAVVGALENLIDQKQDRRGRPIRRGMENRLEPFDLRIEKREAGIE